MVDEDFVMGYAVGQNNVKIVEKTITVSGAYHAADDGADGFDPVIVNIDAMSQKDIDDLMDWVIDQIMPQLPDGTPVPVLPDITVSDLRPSVEGYDRPFLLCSSADGRHVSIMYGVMGEIYGEPGKYFYVDYYIDGVLDNHRNVLQIQGEGTRNSSHLNSDGSVTVVTTFPDGTTETRIWGPYIGGSDFTIVWSV